MLNVFERDLTRYIDEKYYIHSGDYVGNSMLWWALEGKGYTTDLDKAEKYSMDDAKDICKDGKNTAYLVDYINRRVSKSVDMQNISPSESLK